MSKLIIFVHGIGSDINIWDKMIKTIKQNDNTLLEYKTHLDTIGNNNYYYTYGYNSKISTIPIIGSAIELIKGRKSAGNITIKQHAESFTTFLEDKASKFKEINIVAHSMGGLITLLSLFDLNNNNKIKKIMFYGVPILGSEEPEKFQKYFKIASNVLKELKIGSPTLDKIEENIVDKPIKNKFSIKYIDGDADSRIYKLSKDYVKSHIGSYASIQGGHSEIIQPEDIGSESYLKLKEFLLLDKNIIKQKQMVDNFGLQNIFDEKILAKDNYAESIKKSKHRIWAIGKSQSSFISQHAEIINNLIIENKDIEIKIIFWDCHSTLNINDDSKQICCIQDAMKNKSIRHLASTECDNEVIKIKNRINDLKIAIDPENQRNITIGFLNIPTNFSCLITDDDTYFFPFLSNEKSNKSPMIQCSSTKKLGISIIEHYNEIFKEDTFIYNSKLLSEH